MVRIAEDGRAAHETCHDIYLYAAATQCHCCSHNYTLDWDVIHCVFGYKSNSLLSRSQAAVRLEPDYCPGQCGDSVANGNGHPLVWQEIHSKELKNAR